MKVKENDRQLTPEIRSLFHLCTIRSLTLTLTPLHRLFNSRGPGIHIGQIISDSYTLACLQKLWCSNLRR